MIHSWNFIIHLLLYTSILLLLLLVYPALKVFLFLLMTSHSIFLLNFLSFPKMQSQLRFLFLLMFLKFLFCGLFQIIGYHHQSLLFLYLDFLRHLHNHCFLLLLKILLLLHPFLNLHSLHQHHIY